MSDEQRVLRTLLDRDEILELTARYNRTWDDGAFDDWVATWTDTGSFVLPGAPATVGAPALDRMVRAMASVGFVHLTMNHEIVVDRDAAHQTCAALLGTRDPSRAEGTSRWLTTGRYHDQLQRTGSGWRFQERRFVPDATLRALPKWW